MDREYSAKEILDFKFNECQEITSKLEKKSLVSMVMQTREIEKLVVNHKGERDLFKRLKFLNDEEIGNVAFDMQKLAQDVKKFIENLASGRKDEYEDLIKQIKKAAAKLGDDAEEQN